MQIIDFYLITILPPFISYAIDTYWERGVVSCQPAVMVHRETGLKKILRKKLNFVYIPELRQRVLLSPFRKVVVVDPSRTADVCTGHK